MSEDTNLGNSGDEQAPAKSFVLQTSRSQYQNSDFQQLIRWLYTNNPFYVISAALVFIGLWRSFCTSNSTFHPGSLGMGLAIYTLLLAFTAWFLIRYGSLWQDVRTLLVLVILMFLGISISFDRSLTEGANGCLYLPIGGLFFAVVLSEALLRGIRLRLPTAYRVPYYALLALFFLYPLAMSFWAYQPDLASTRWVMFGFSPLAAAIFLTLSPAIRRGARYVANNGSPWLWPLYPWTLFFMLGLGVILRAHYLCISFHAVDGSRSIFGRYFLSPFVWALAWLSLEAWRASWSKRAKALALVLPMLALALAKTATPDHIDDFGFLLMFRNTFGMSPLFATLLAVIFFYCIAWLRGLSEASFPLLLCVLGSSICGRNTFNLDTPSHPHGLPILAVGIVLLLAGVRMRRALRCLFGAWCIVLMLWIDLAGTPFTAFRGAIPAHMMVLCMLIVGLLFRNETGKAIQKWAAATLLTFALIVALCPASELGNPPNALLIAYPLSVMVVAAAYGFATKNYYWYYGCAIGSFCGWLVVPGWRLFVYSRQTLAGMDYLAWGAVSFLLALFVSLLKMNFFGRLHQHWCNKKSNSETNNDS